MGFVVVNSGTAQSVSVSAYLDTNAIKIGEQTVFHLNTRFITGSSWDEPQLSDSLTSKIEIIKKLPWDTAENDDGTWEIKRKYLITSFDSGYHVIPPLLFKQDGDSVFTEPHLLQVKTIPVDTTEAYKPIKGIRHEPLNFSDFIPWILGALIILAAAILILVLVKRMKKKSPDYSIPQKPQLPPGQEALKRLDELKEQKLWQHDQTKKYYIELTTIIRHYIERQFKIDSEELTSRETLEQIKLKIPEEAYEKLKQLLELADLVKFARMKPLPDEISRSSQQAYDFVQLTKSTEPTEKNTNE